MNISIVVYTFAYVQVFVIDFCLCIITCYARVSMNCNMFCIFTRLQFLYNYITVVVYAFAYVQFFVLDFFFCFNTCYACVSMNCNKSRVSMNCNKSKKFSYFYLYNISLFQNIVCKYNTKGKIIIAFLLMYRFFTTYYIFLDVKIFDFMYFYYLVAFLHFSIIFNRLDFSKTTR